MSEETAEVAKEWDAGIKEIGDKIVALTLMQAKELERKTEDRVKLLKSRGIKLFGKWDTTEVSVSDPGLRGYINLTPIHVPRTLGRDIKNQFHKSKKPIVERLMNKLMVSGHKGKKHWRTSRHNTGKAITIMKNVKKAFEIIETKTKQNPVQIFVKAIEVGSPREGIATIEYGGVKYPKALDLSPQRRIDLALRWITQGAFAKSAGGKAKRNIWQSLADELIATANNDAAKSNCVTKKTELERQAQASR